MTSSCDSDLWTTEDNNTGSYVSSDLQPIATSLENAGDFQEWIKVLVYSENYSVLNSLYDGSGKSHKYTHFAPTDDAIRAFYQQKGVAGIEELGKTYATAMVRTMTIDEDSLKLSEKFTAIVSELNYKCEFNEYLSIKVDTVELGFLMVNNSGKEPIHISRGYEVCSNGYYYVADGVLSPLVETVYDRLIADGGSQIMQAALQATGYNKDLSTVADTIYSVKGREIVPRSYTVLNVSDEVFAQYGILSLSDLKNKLKEHAASTTMTDDELLKQYVEYHLFEMPYTSSRFLEMGEDTVRIWETMAEHQILMISKSIEKIETTEGPEGLVNDTTFVLYFNTDDISGQSLDKINSDIIANNGYLHNLKGWMPVYEPKPTTVVWELTDYAEVRNKVIADGYIYQPASYATNENLSSLTGLKCYEVEVDPEGTANKDYFALSYATVKSNLKNCLHSDRLVINVGYMGSVSMKSPTIAKGKYRVSVSMAYTTQHSDIRQLKNCKGGLMRLTVDGENEIMTAPYTTITKQQPDVYSADLYDEIEFKETGSHVFKLVVLDPAASTSSKFSLQFDAITFTPIE